MRIEYVNNTVAGEEILNLNMTYGVTLKIRGEVFKYEMTIEDLTRAISPQDIQKARRQSYVATTTVSNNVKTNPVIKGVEFILNGQLQASLSALKSPAFILSMMPAQQKQFKIGDRAVEEHVKDFKGISINLKQIKF